MTEYKHRSGFTLVEMLIIIGIIGILAGALVTGAGHLRRVAVRTKAQNAVTDTKVALTIYLQNEREWHETMIDRLEVDYDVAKILSRNKLLDAVVPNDPATSTSLDRFGLLDEWGRKSLRENPNITTASQRGSDGIPVEDHRIQFRLDTDYDGYVDGNEGAPKGLKIRSSVIVWSRGPDGQDDFASSNPKAKAHYPFDDLISWEHSKVVADQ